MSCQNLLEHFQNTILLHRKIYEFYQALDAWRNVVQREKIQASAGHPARRSAVSHLFPKTAWDVRQKTFPTLLQNDADIYARWQQVYRELSDMRKRHRAQHELLTASQQKLLFYILHQKYRQEVEQRANCTPPAITWSETLLQLATRTEMADALWQSIQVEEEAAVPQQGAGEWLRWTYDVFDEVKDYLGGGSSGDVYTLRGAYAQGYALKEIYISNTQDYARALLELTMSMTFLTPTDPQQPLCFMLPQQHLYMPFAYAPADVYSPVRIIMPRALSDADPPNLKAFLKQTKWPEKMHTHVVLQWCRELIYAVACLHRHQFMHRDIKEPNVFLVQREQGPQMVLADMGYATPLFHASIPYSTLVNSIPVPEIERKKNEACTWYTESSDVYALGHTLRGLLSVLLPTTTQQVAYIEKGERTSKTRWSILETTAPEIRLLHDTIQAMVAEDANQRITLSDALKTLYQIRMEDIPCRFPSMKKMCLERMPRLKDRQRLWRQLVAAAECIPDYLQTYRAHILLLSFECATRLDCVVAGNLPQPSRMTWCLSTQTYLIWLCTVLLFNIAGYSELVDLHAFPVVGTYQILVELNYVVFTQDVFFEHQRRLLAGARGMKQVEKWLQIHSQEPTAEEVEVEDSTEQRAEQEQASETYQVEDSVDPKEEEPDQVEPKEEIEIRAAEQVEVPDQKVSMETLDDFFE